MPSGKRGKSRRRRLVLRLPFPPRANNHRHDGSYSKAAGRQGGGIPNYLRKAFQKGKAEFGGSGLRLSDLMGMLRHVIASLRQVFICIDALDECLPKHLPKLLESLRDIVRESPNTRVFLTGRPHIGEDVQRYFNEAVVIHISPKTDGIRNYPEMRLDRDSEPDAMNNDLRADIVRVILEKIADMCVTLFSIFTLSMIYTYQRLCVDFSLFHST